MAENETLHGGLGMTWLQPGGPNTQPYYLGCYEVADTTEPLGEIKRARVPDPHRPGQWREVFIAQDAPDAVTTSLLGLTGKTSDYLQRAIRGGACPMGLYIVWAECGPRPLFNNYDVIKVLENAFPTSLGEGALSEREGVSDTTQTWAINARKAELIYPLVVCQSENAGLYSLRDITACGEDRCYTPSGRGGGLCDTLYACTASTGGVFADVMISTDAGETWTATSAHPFGAGQTISSIVCFPVTPYTHRIIVAGYPSGVDYTEISYSDDSGGSWTNVVIGAVASDGALWNGSLCALDMYHLWLGTMSGYIYFSNDGGATWTQQASLAFDIMAINFAGDYNGIAVGELNTIYNTTDGGATWTLSAGPAPKAGVLINSCWAVDRWRWFVGYNDGDLYYTNDGGVTWAERLLPLPVGLTAIVRVNDIKAYDEYILFLAAHGTLSGNNYPVVYRSYDGGYTWESVYGAVQNAGGYGAEALQVCGANDAYAVGKLVGTTGTMLHVAESCSYDVSGIALCEPAVKLGHECRSQYVALVLS